MSKNKPSPSLQKVAEEQLKSVSLGNMPKNLNPRWVIGYLVGDLRKISPVNQEFIGDTEEFKGVRQPLEIIHSEHTNYTKDGITKGSFKGKGDLKKSGLRLLYVVKEGGVFWAVYSKTKTSGPLCKKASSVLTSFISGDPVKVSINWVIVRSLKS